MKNLEKYDIIRVFDAGALARNLERARIATTARLGITIKADAYGFSLERALPVFKHAGVKDFFVQDILEAVRAKKILESGNVYTYAGVQDGQAAEFVKNGIIPVCLSLAQLEYFNGFAKGLGKKPAAAIHFDTGMNRTGLSMLDMELLAANWKRFVGNLNIVLYISHLHGPFENSHISRGQLARFKDILRRLPKRPASLSASAGLFRLGREYHLDLVRPGYGIYGMAPGMEQPMRVYAKILQIRDVARGETIGYSDEYTARRAMKIAVLNIGYKDGYSRNLSRTNGLFNWVRALLHSGGGFTRAFVMIGGLKCPLVGIVSMNNIMVDVSAVPAGILATERWALVAGPGAPISSFRTAIGYAPAEMLVDLAHGNPNALDLTPAEFKRIMPEIA